MPAVPVFVSVFDYGRWFGDWTGVGLHPCGDFIFYFFLPFYLLLHFLHFISEMETETETQRKAGSAGVWIWKPHGVCVCEYFPPLDVKVLGRLIVFLLEVSGLSASLNSTKKFCRLIFRLFLFNPHESTFLPLLEVKMKILLFLLFVYVVQLSQQNIQ